MKKVIALTCALALAAGSAMAVSGAGTRALEAQFMGITLKVDGNAVVPKDVNGETVEPFAVDGTVYLPVRAVGEALGKDVSWDGGTNTVSVDAPAPLVEDARQLISFIEGCHPAFALGKVPEGYEAAKEELLTTAASPQATTADLAWAAKAYTASLKDGHTNLDIFDGNPQAALALNWAADGDTLYLLDEKGALTGETVTEIAGLSVAEVFAMVDKYVASENEAARDVNHAQWAGLLPLLAPELGGNYADAEVKVSNGESQRTMRVPFAYPEDSGAPEAVITSEQMGDVFYIDMNQCVLDESTSAVAESLAAAVKAGTDKVIIDVRGNGGGNSAACELLLNAMGMEAPYYGGYLRYSPLAKLQRGYEYGEGHEMAEPDLTPAKANPDIKLVVLTDEWTYSSATMLGVFVRDGKLGTLIGRPSANSPCSYGDILSFALGNTSMRGTVSHKQFLRPDAEADPAILTPDVLTGVGEDALEVALEMLNQ